MFLSREDKELKKQRQDKIQKLNQKFNKLNAEYQNEMEAYTRSMSPKWEYTQISTKDDKASEKIRNLGRIGWEMVGVTSFTEGGTFGGAGSYSLYTLYVFKRQLPKFPQEFTDKYNAIMELRQQIERLNSQ